VTGGPGSGSERRRTTRGTTGTAAGASFVASPPRRLPIYRLDGHTRDGDRPDADKLLVTVGRHSWLAVAILDVDGHSGEKDVRQAFSWAEATYFGGEVYDEPADRGHHGYPLFDRNGVTDQELNELLHRAHNAIGALAKAAGFKAPIEIKGRITLLDHRGCVIPGKRGGLFALPRLPSGWDSLERCRGSVIHGLDALRRIIADEEQLLRGNKPMTPDCVGSAASASSESPDEAARAGASRRARRQRASGTHTVKLFSPLICLSAANPYELKLRVCQELARALGRVPTVEEVSVAYDPLRDHPSDPIRVRNIGKAIRACARTFDPSKLGRAGDWTVARAALLQAAHAQVTDAVYDKGGGSKWRAKVSEEELVVALYALTLNSFAQQRDPDQPVDVRL
jgi:hypothetical protein